MAVQTEAGAVRDPRLNCQRCGGDGTIAVRPRDCHHHGNCPCGSDEIECPECSGSGVRSCLNCGAPATIVRTNETLCAGCL